MSNSLLTPTAITRKALMVLHQKCNFIGNINRQYDDAFAKSGGAGITRGKIGPNLTIRMPNEYTVRSGLVMEAQSQSEASQVLTMSTVKGVDMYFGSDELTLTIDDFSERYIEPAMSVLAANIEADALNMYKDVYNLIDGDTVAFGFNSVVDAKTKLTDGLAPQDKRRFLLNTSHANKFLKDTKSLFQSSDNISEQYKEGSIGRTGGFDHFENTLLLPHLTGSAIKVTTYTVNGAVTANGSAQVTVQTGATTFKKGDVFTVAGCNRVHPETKVDTGVVQQFVVTEDYAGGAGNLKFAPAIYTSGGRQNVVAAGMANTAAITKVGAAANETLVQSLAFHKDAFTFVTADLEQPKGVDFAAREVMDGISMSLVRDFAIADRSFPCRLDVLYGYKTLRPQLATRVHNDG